jgi:predicted AlkP superfamily phosphohydrolase/phosphomutase/tetratricopeptide (TPR) repeat protein
MKPAPRKLLLIGWDSADWKLLRPLMESGQMPNLARLVARGSMGSISTIHPVYSPMLWTSIATGKRPYKHGILGFGEPLPDGSGVRPVSSLSRKCRAFWNIFHQQGWSGHVVGWWPSHPVEPIRGSMISNLCHRAVGPTDKPWPVPPGGMHPPELVEEFAALRFNPNELVAEMVEPFIPKVREVDQDKDGRVASLMRVLAECVTVHNWGMWLVENTEWDYCCVYYDAMDHFGHAFMRYHPPQQPGVADRDFELYSGVMAQAARFHDLMLGAMLSKVPADTTVVLLSDHGFHPDHLRRKSLAPVAAGPAAEHSDFGILVVSGPGLKQDELIHGASILDVAPTLLTLNGLPVGEDMDGRPMVGLWKEPPVVGYIPTWEEVPGEDGRHPAEYRQDPASEKAALDQLVALGYIAAPGNDVAKEVAAARLENDLALAESLMDGGCDAEAFPILDRLHREAPEDYRLALRLAMCSRALGRIEDLRRVVTDLDTVRRPAAEAARRELAVWRAEFLRRRDARLAAAQSRVVESGADGASGAPGPIVPLVTLEERREIRDLRRRAQLGLKGVDFLKGLVAIADRRFGEALRCFESVSETQGDRPEIHLQSGQVLARMGQWSAARQAFERALAIDRDNPHALAGLARVSLAERRFEEAAGFALGAVQRVYQYPLAHFVLGLALFRLQHSERAVAAWETAVRLKPDFWAAHVRLARWFRHREPARSQWHREQVLRIRRDRASSPAARSSLHSPAHTAPVPDAEPAVFAPSILGLARPTFSPPVVTLVTGLPRSGTSMLMQMLVAGGVPPLTDGIRSADDDNPRGYLELEAVKELARDASCLDEAGGKLVKIVLPLLPHLPEKHRYHVILIERDMDEILASQAVMLERLGRDLPAADPGMLRLAYGRLLRMSRDRLAGHSGIRALRVSHRWLLANPLAAAEAMADFLGGNLDIARMAAAVETSLYRQRRGPV